MGIVIIAKNSLQPTNCLKITPGKCTVWNHSFTYVNVGMVVTWPSQQVVSSHMWYCNGTPPLEHQLKFKYEHCRFSSDSKMNRGNKSRS